MSPEPQIEEAVEGVGTQARVPHPSTKPQIAIDVLERRLQRDDRSIKLMGDTAYNVLELGLHAQHQQVTLVTTGRFDAVLHEPPPKRTQHTIGRPRVVGKRLPALE